MKRIALLGSTGSIGRQTLEVVRAFPDRLGIFALAAGWNLELLAEQAREFGPRLIFSRSPALSALPTPLGCAVASPEEMASHPEVDLVVVATSGMAGLLPTLAAIRKGKTIALANKEVLVMAGELVMAEARRYGAQIRPIDSEHSALWQCLQGERGEIGRLILTASGGAFRDYPPSLLEGATAEEALRHPTWQMGRKVTVDSATLMNKGFEAIEAHWLFGLALSRIEVVIHRESIVHSLVEFADGSVKAQLSPPDMRLPIQYALSFPERWSNPELPKLDLAATRALTFEAPDLERYPCLRLAFEAGEKGGTYPAVLSAADEVAVALFLSGKITLGEIASLVEEALREHQGLRNPSLEDVLAADAWVRERWGASLKV